jgi:hypothetical protein
VTALRLSALPVLVLTLVAPSAALAQGSEPRVEITGAVLFAGGVDFGTRNATLTGNDPGNPDFTLFSTTSTLGRGIGPEARLGVALTRALSVEGAFSWVHQTLETRVTGDAESAPNTTVTQSVATMAIGGDAIVRLTSATFSGGKGMAFVLAGGGYFRQTDDHQVQLASGGYFEAGGGARYVVSHRAKGFPRMLAIRGDGRFIVRSNAFDPIDGNGSHTTWAVTGGMSVGF